jgi:hypothetical protein
MKGNYLSAPPRSCPHPGNRGDILIGFPDEKYVVCNTPFCEVIEKAILSPQIDKSLKSCGQCVEISLPGLATDVSSLVRANKMSTKTYNPGELSQSAERKRDERPVKDGISVFDRLSFFAAPTDWLICLLFVQLIYCHPQSFPFYNVPIEICLQRNLTF